MITNQMQNYSYVQNILKLNSAKSHTILFGLGISALKMKVGGYDFFSRNERENYKTINK